MSGAATATPLKLRETNCELVAVTYGNAAGATNGAALYASGASTLGLAFTLAMTIITTIAIWKQQQQKWNYLFINEKQKHWIIEWNVINFPSKLKVIQFEFQKKQKKI